ncbi:MAG: hypothetical protein CME59_14390 [Halioglobus sp.]|nr:hypothetical protein [Halioglobus sp.]
MDHYHFWEARVCLSVLQKSEDPQSMGVIGTTDNQRAELYGWNNPVKPHIDSLGGSHWMYGLLLSGNCSLSIKERTIDLEQGDIFRLDDSVRHWTEGRGQSICAFAGTWRTPADDTAVQTLTRGVQRLANGTWRAPRIGPGFRILQPGEVLATNDFNKSHTVPRTLADRRGWHILRCSRCLNPAVVLDDYWPYHNDNSLCTVHHAIQELT